jgi:glucokinase
MSAELVLAGDVGGTKTDLALCRRAPDSEGGLRGIEILFEHRYANREFSSLAAIARDFIGASGQRPVRACFGIAGAVLDGGTTMPNLGWHLTEAGLAEALHVRSVSLINDLEATALGIETLSPDQLLVLNAGRPALGGSRALIAAGTGLGMALLFHDGSRYRVYASEGGHADFAPNDTLQIALLQHLRGQLGHVSWERVVSGPGLVAIYRFLEASGGLASAPGPADRIAAATDPAAAIAAAGLAGESPIVVQALDLFVAAYGAAAGNLALTALATGGLYVGGGIAPKLIDRLRDGSFMAAFVDKGRFATLLADVPVRVILEPKTALRGAAVHAFRLPV